MNKYIVQNGLIFSITPYLDFPDLLFIGIEWVMVEAISDKDAIYQADLFKAGVHPKQKEMVQTFEKVRFIEDKREAQRILFKELFPLPPDVNGLVKEIEAIGYTSYRAKVNYSKKRYWVAEITGIDSKYEFKRTFIEGKIDFARSNRRATRGVYIYYHLNSYAIYEISNPISNNHTVRYFCYIEDGQEVRM